MAIWVSAVAKVGVHAIGDALFEDPADTLELLARMAAQCSDPDEAWAFAQRMAQSSGGSIAEERVASFLLLLADALDAEHKTGAR